MFSTGKNRKKNPKLLVKICISEPYMTPHPNISNATEQHINIDIHRPDNLDSPSTASFDQYISLSCQPYRRVRQVMLEETEKTKCLISAAQSLIFLPGSQPGDSAPSMLLLSDWLVGGNWPTFQRDDWVDCGLQNRGVVGKRRRNKHIFVVVLCTLVG